MNSKLVWTLGKHRISQECCFPQSSWRGDFFIFLLHGISSCTSTEPWSIWYACCSENLIRVDMCTKTASSFLLSKRSANTFQTVVLFGLDDQLQEMWEIDLLGVQNYQVDSQEKLRPWRKFISKYAQLEDILESPFHGRKGLLLFTTIEKTEAEKCLYSLKKTLKHMVTV